MSREVAAAADDRTRVRLLRRLAARVDDRRRSGCLGRTDVGRVVRFERLHKLRRPEARAAVRGRVVVDGVLIGVTPHVGELAVGHVHVSVAGHRDVGELNVVHRLAQLERARERPAVVGRADEKDARVEAVGRVAGEARPGEVDVAVTWAAGAIDLDRRLVVELAEQVRRRGALRDVDRLLELLAVVDRGGGLATWVFVRPHPDVAEGLRRAGWIARALRAGEKPAVVVPGEHRVAGVGGAHVGARRIR